MEEHKLFSVILLSYYSEDRLKDIVKYYIDELEKEKIPFELIIMDDGSKDQSYEIALGLEKSDKRIRSYQLSKNYTSPYSQFAGLSVCKGACAMFVSDDYQRSAENMTQSYRMWEEGHKIVVSSRESRDDGWFTELFANIFYKIMNSLSEVDYPKGGTDGFLADREIIDIINNQISPRRTSAIMEVLRLGFQPHVIKMDRLKSVGKSRWTWKKKINLAKDTFFAASSFPIRFISWLGFVMFFLSMLIIIVVVSAKLFTANKLFGFPIPGWATIVTLMALFQGLVLLSLGMVAEYIWRIYEEVKRRPGYIIKSKKSDHK